MAKTKEPVAQEIIPTETELESEPLDFSSNSLREEAEKNLSPETLRIVKKIAYYTSKVGLPLDEACLLVNIDYEKFIEEVKLEPLIGKIIRAKELEWKKDMLVTISRKARSGDDKLAQWLLERKFPDEYGDKKPKSGPDQGDILFEAIRFIRRNGDSSPLVHEMESNLVQPINSSPRSLQARIEDILN